ncbi:Phosphoribosylformylglycinamidine synthase 2 [Desulfovibrio sp. X2]|uniref:AIR synthase-related protein n=1 Tax=Desulfovibrio sp. X2 TaxID=941449 RepID=UPI000358DF40|nr:AIR synthase-related protein [Desulfovibrio sp. X2]EPR44728.1 Phosphoribosylformylglycinamidine synthase 2 [Desulfovibrio sp. X2]
MLFRVHVALKPTVIDTPGRKAAAAVKNALGLDVRSARIVKVFTVEGLTAEQVETAVARGALHDPVLHEASLSPLASGYDWLIEVGFRPGVTDNEGRTARETLAVVLGLPPEAARGLSVYTSTQYLFSGDLSREQAGHIATDLLANELIQRYELRAASEGADIEPKAAEVTAQGVSEVATIDIFAMSDAELMDFSRANTLALSLSELHAIRDHFASDEVVRARAKLGMPKLPTDAEIEILAQTWSEHCKHKIFNARITYRDEESGGEEVVDSLFKTCIAASTRDVRAAKGEDDLCLSVFKDNAGVFRFTDEVAACVKMETHNSPSALDPYGGALTGIVGVNRDPMGTGMGAELICNTDVFCFASPFHEAELPPRLLHPRRVLEGVREGVEHGGNKSGIPTVNGSIVFDERYLGKPLVYCGTLGLMPMELQGRPAYEKYHQAGDAVVMVGGRIGKDGIHGATFSSEELHEGSPATAVQIGDPITQRKMYDFLMRARDMGLYSAITDNGAGGLSSSIGEMAEATGGARIDLEKAPLKYPGLRPWEVLLSEAQERMSLAVPPKSLPEFLKLAGEMDVEATVLGEFTDSGYFHATWGETPVACLDMEFLHEGVPQMELCAVWKAPRVEASPLPEVADQGGLLRRMLGRLNICSKEYVVRQYDHEVQGGSAVKPFVGLCLDGPADAGVIRPVLESEQGLAVSHGICPKFSDFDTYWMMAGALDEAVRNAVAVGADPDRMIGVDNFCWCDPVQSEKTPDGEYKLAQLVRANRALAHFCRSYGVPCISGKDSMKNDYTGGGAKISIPPTVLFSVVGIVPDVSKCLTSDFKRAGERIYLLGATAAELAGTELAQELGLAGGAVPQVDALAAQARYRALFTAAGRGLVSACHDCSDGGLGVALAEMAIGGRMGAAVDLDAVPAPGEPLSDLALLYAESHSRLLVTVPEDKAADFEALFAGQAAGLLGRTTDDAAVRVARGGRELFAEPVDGLARAFKATLDW